MEQKSHIYLVEYKGEGWSETYLCQSKAEVEKCLLVHVDPSYETKSEVIVHEGDFHLKHSTKPEIKIYW